MPVGGAKPIAAAAEVKQVARIDDLVASAEASDTFVASAASPLVPCAIT
jgi:hypothetical protein